MPISLAVAIDPQQILDRLEPVLPGLCAAVLDAATEAKEDLAARNLLPLYDWNHHASTVRTTLIRDIQDHPIADGFRLVHEASSGVHARWGDFRLKVLKDPSDLPIVTATARKKGYCRQPEIQTALQFFPDGEVRELRLVLYWQVDAGYNLRTLRLACPVDAEGEGTEDGWSVSVLHLIDHLLVGDEEQVSPADDGPQRDLDIRAKSDQTPQPDAFPDSTLDIQPKTDQPEAAGEEDAGEVG